MYLIFKYQGLCNIELGTELTLHGFFITFFFKPIKDPMSTRGAEQHIQSTNNTIISTNLIYIIYLFKFTLADDPSNQNKMLSIIKIVNKIPGYKKAVNKVFLSQAFPPNIL